MEVWDIAKSTKMLATVMTTRMSDIEKVLPNSKVHLRIYADKEVT